MERGVQELTENEERQGEKAGEMLAFPFPFRTMALVDEGAEYVEDVCRRS